MIEFLKIIVLAILAAIVYGIVHDQITARVCVEYFSVYHPPIFGGTKNPTLLAFGWGVIATWWVGLPLGVMLACCSRFGRLPKLSTRDLMKPLIITLAVLGGIAAIAGFSGYFIASSIPPDVPTRLPSERIPFLEADAFAHVASYCFGALLGIALCIWVLVRRFRRANKMVGY